jgi:hypothetical protein
MASFGGTGTGTTVTGSGASGGGCHSCRMTGSGSMSQNRKPPSFRDYGSKSRKARTAGITRTSRRRKSRKKTIY